MHIAELEHHSYWTVIRHNEAAAAVLCTSLITLYTNVFCAILYRIVESVTELNNETSVLEHGTQASKVLAYSWISVTLDILIPQQSQLE
jgi:hypothetical protein